MEEAKQMWLTEHDEADAGCSIHYICPLCDRSHINILTSAFLKDNLINLHRVTLFNLYFEKKCHFCNELFSWYIPIEEYMEWK